MILKEAMIMADAFSLPLESLPDWLEIEYVDSDDLVLSQVLQEVEEDMSFRQTYMCDSIIPSRSRGIGDNGQNGAQINYKTSNETIQKKVSNVLNPPRDATETAVVPFFEENFSEEPTTENTNVLATPPMKRQRTTPEILKDFTNTKGEVQFSNCNFNFH